MSEQKFTYTYTAPTEEQRREIEDIKKQYGDEPIVKDKITQLRELHSRVKTPPLIVAIVLGVIGVLVFGTGLTLVLEWSLTYWGIAVAAIGCVIMAIAHPVRQLMLKRNKQRYGDQIVALSNELLNEDEENK